MARRTIMLTWIMVLCLPIVSVHSQYHSQSQPFDPKMAKVTNLHFYMHETVGDTGVLVAQANISRDDNNSSIPTPSLFVVNNPVTVGLDRSSKVIGNVQGMAAIINGASGVLYYDVGFTDGYFNGSSFGVFSRSSTIETEREYTVVGGRRKFRMATGFALVKAYYTNQTSFSLEFNVTMVHYYGHIFDYSSQ